MLERHRLQIQTHLHLCAACPLSKDLTSLGWSFGWFPFLYIANFLNGKHYTKFHILYLHTYDMCDQKHSQWTNWFWMQNTKIGWVWISGSRFKEPHHRILVWLKTRLIFKRHMVNAQSFATKEFLMPCAWDPKSCTLRWQTNFMPPRDSDRLHVIPVVWGLSKTWQSQIDASG